MTAWQIALNQLNGTKVKQYRHCAYCGTSFSIPKNAQNKAHCSPECYRKVRTMRLARERIEARVLPALTAPAG